MEEDLEDPDDPLDLEGPLANSPFLFRHRLSIELKFFDFEFDFQPTSSLGNVVDTYVPIAQNFGDDGRIGRRVRIRRISIRYTVRLPSTAFGTLTSDCFRIILYLDAQANQNTATVGDVLVQRQYNSMVNLVNRSRFVILMDRTVDINSASATATTWGAMDITNQFSIFHDIVIQYLGTTGLIAEITSNNLGIVCITANGIAGIIAFVRVRYSDM